MKIVEFKLKQEELLGIIEEWFIRQDLMETNMHLKVESFDDNLNEIFFRVVGE